MAKQESISLIQFQKKFKTEADCHQHLFKMKWPDGFCCPKCKHTKAYEIKTRKLPLYECANCEHQTTVIAGTIFEKTRTGLLKWFWAIYLIAHDKRGISNAKAFIGGTFHGLDPKHLQAYLDEFCYRFNRREASSSTDSYNAVSRHRR